MAVVTIGLPVFKGTDDEDLNVFIDLYRGHLDSLNIDPTNRAGNLSPAKRAMGILRSCMQGQASVWFDREITGKNWKIANIRKNGNALLNAFRQLAIPEGAGGPNVNTYVPNSTSALYSAIPANNAITIGEAFIPSDALIGGDTAWKRSGGCPATDDPNILYNGANGNGNPLVYPGILPN
jgi:hypothetical protein